MENHFTSRTSSKDIKEHKYSHPDAGWSGHAPFLFWDICPVSYTALWSAVQIGLLWWICPCGIVTSCVENGASKKRSSLFNSDTGNPNPDTILVEETFSDIWFWCSCWFISYVSLITFIYPGEEEQHTTWMKTHSCFLFKRFTLFLEIFTQLEGQQLLGYQFNLHPFLFHVAFS